MRRTTWSPLVATAVVLTVAACTASSSPARPTAPAPRSPAATTPAAASPTPVSSGPVDPGPTTTADGTCPFLTTEQALDDVGERLGRVTVSTRRGAPVGCTFYPATGALAVSEHLPPPTVPMVRVTVTRYADDTAAHNAMVVMSRSDPAAYSDPTSGVDEAISFATTFYAADGDQDRAYTFRRGPTVVVVETAQTDQPFDAKHAGTDVAGHLSQAGS